MHKRRHFSAKQGCGFEIAHAQRTIADEPIKQEIARIKRGDQQSIGPDNEANHETGNRAACCGAAPKQAPQKSGRNLRNGGERQEPHLCQLRFARIAVIGESHQQKQNDRNTADDQDQRAQIMCFNPCAQTHRAQQARHNQIIRNHDRQGHGGDNHHGRCS